MSKAERAKAGLVVRRATLEDAPALRAIAKSAFRADIDATLAKPLDWFFQGRHRAAFIAHVDGRPCGCLLATGPDQVILHALGVTRRSRKRGVSVALIAEAVRWAKDVGAQDLLAVVNTRIRPAAKANGFQHNGFESHARFKGYNVWMLSLAPIGVVSGPLAGSGPPAPGSGS